MSSHNEDLKSVLNRHTGRTKKGLGKYDVLVIDFPYFEKPADGNRGGTRYAFFVARRRYGSSQDWRVERQEYTRRSDSISVSDSDFKHGPDSRAADIADLMHQFQQFELKCYQNGMKRNERDESSYVYGATMPEAVALFRDELQALPQISAPKR